MAVTQGQKGYIIVYPQHDTDTFNKPRTGQTVFLPTMGEVLRYLKVHDGECLRVYKAVEIYSTNGGKYYGNS